jgi:hypothetical protein
MDRKFPADRAPEETHEVLINYEPRVNSPPPSSNGPSTDHPEETHEVLINYEPRVNSPPPSSNDLPTDHPGNITLSKLQSDGKVRKVLGYMCFSRDNLKHNLYDPPHRVINYASSEDEETMKRVPMNRLCGRERTKRRKVQRRLLLARRATRDDADTHRPNHAPDALPLRPSNSSLADRGTGEDSDADCSDRSSSPNYDY